ncbi:FlgD immunoglobulin-like domain containing protein [Streptomyces anulatus]|uniref:FlgD immunoglobulin-like domain containing protein n=1 Tax=Streptomyces anulatus TaxID=1892 RepID=UPI00331735F5
MASRHRTNRTRLLVRGTLTTAVALAATGGALPFHLSGAHAETMAPQTLTINAPDRYLPRSYNLESAGTAADLNRTEVDGSDAVTAYRWSPATGDPQTVGKDPADASAERIGGHASDVVGVYTTADRSVELKDMKAGSAARFTLPEGQTYHGTYGDSVVTATWTAGGDVDSLHLLRLRDGQLTDTPVTGENGVRAASYKVLGADDGLLAIFVSGDSTGQIGLVDLATGKITGVLKGSWGSDHTQVVFSGTHAGWFDPAYGDQKVHLLRKDALNGTETTVDVASTYEQRSYVALVGSWVVSLRQTESYRNSDAPKDRGEPLLAAPMGGGEARTLLPHARLGGKYGLNPTPDGGVLVAGGSSAGDWAVREVGLRADGSPGVNSVRAVAPKPGTYGEVALAAGDLAVQETDTNYLPSLYKRHIELGGTPSAGNRSLVVEPPLSTDGTGGSAGSGAYALGDGAFAYPKGNGIVVRSNPDDAVTVAAPGSGRVVDASGRYVVFGYGYVSGFGQYQQYVIDREKSGDDKVLLTRTASAAAVWGSTFWTPGDTKGTVKATDLKSGTTESFSLGKECTPTDLQAVGRWVYWACEGSGDPVGSGVWDRTTQRMIDVPMGGELGDGYVVRHDETAGELQLVDFHTVTNVTSRPLADITGYLAHGYYAVDRFGGGVAYAPERGKPGAMRAVGSGVPTSSLAGIEAETETSLDSRSATDARWDGSWQLSKPGAPGAQVVIKDAGGNVVRELDAVQNGAALTTAWDGRNSGGAFAHNGPYTWELTAAPQDGQGAELKLSGAITVKGAGTAAAPKASGSLASRGSYGTVYDRDPLAARRENTL